MFRFNFLVALFSVFFATSAYSTVIHFESDFDSVMNRGATITDGSYQLRRTAGYLSTFGGQLGFNLASGNREQVELELGAGFDNYRVEFDLITNNLANSQHGFTVNFDTPRVQNLNFNNCCNNRVSTFTPGTSNLINQIGYLEDDTPMHVVIDVDLLLDEWQIDISGVGSTRGDFNSTGGDVDSIRFGLSTKMGGINADPTVSVFMDNLVVSSSVPEPSTLGLFLSSSLILLAVKRNRRKRSSN